MENFDSFIQGLKTTSNTTIVEFKTSDVVLAKLDGKFYFFEKNLSLITKAIIPREVVKGCQSSFPTERFIKEILLKVYTSATTYTGYYYSKSGFPILSDKDFQAFRSINSTPQFLFYPVWVAQCELSNIERVLQENSLVPNGTTIRTLDDSPVSEDFKNLISNFKDVIWKWLFGTKKGTDIPIDQDSLKDKLLSCEEVRCGLERYKETLLTDPKRGHWDLMNVPEKDRYGYIARDPKNDISDSVVGIDFGTKSTVVYYLDSNSEILPVPVGDAKSSNRRYENPTVLHFISLEKFLKDYISASGRPETEWKDLTAAHTAQRQYDGDSSKNNSSYLSHLKQWTSGNEDLRIRAVKDGKLKDLKKFSEIKEDDFNPIEIYAYYIGLYINNMRNTKSIYFDYYLSYPVTCTDAIKEKIRLSFERGLKKSLPPSLLEDKETMKKFKVRCYISEPQAYAVCALQEFGLEESTNYAVFDFGGGTTDYDFGIWNEGSGKYDFEIQSFGSQGISTCGGENILEDLAFEIFRQNVEVIKNGDKYCPFKLGPNSKNYPEIDKYCVESSESDRNMHTLVELLRPFWEKSAEYLEDDEKLPNGDNADASVYERDENDSTKILINIGLCDNEGEEVPGLKLSVTKQFIKEFIIRRIRFAVDDFFNALNNWGSNFIEGKINIFLAGNSSKSPYVTEMFNEKIADKVRYNGLKDFELVLYPPLGEDAVEKIKERRPDYEFSSKEPTGKSGVAFGLISSREGGEVKILDSQTQAGEFLYYIGTIKKKKFLVLDSVCSANRKPALNQWYPLFEADSSNFEIFYTDKASCLNGDLPKTEVRFVKKSIDATDANKFIFVRAVSPRELEYTVADCADNIPQKSDFPKIEFD